MQQRVETIYRLGKKDAKIIVTYPEALFEKMVPGTVIDSSRLGLQLEVSLIWMKY